MREERERVPRQDRAHGARDCLESRQDRVHLRGPGGMHHRRVGHRPRRQEAPRHASRKPPRPASALQGCVRTSGHYHGRPHALRDEGLGRCCSPRHRVRTRNPVDMLLPWLVGRFREEAEQQQPLLRRRLHREGQGRVRADALLSAQHAAELPPDVLLRGLPGNDPRDLRAHRWRNAAPHGAVWGVFATLGLARLGR